MSYNNSFDVIIVGLGPVGSMLANLLGKFNLKILVLEKKKEIHPLPRAIHFDGEVMRIFQNAGLSTEIKKIARASHKGMHFLGPDNKTLMVRKGFKGIGDQGWENNWYFFQPDLEKILRKGLQRFSNVTIRLGEEVTDIANNKLSTQVTTKIDMSEEKKSYESIWVVGCDGANSMVSKRISSEIEDFGLNEKWLVVDLKIKKGSVRAASLPRYTIQHCNPKRPMTRCFINSSRRRWEIMVLPDDKIEEIVVEKFIWSILNPWLTPADAEIERAQIYTFHSIIKKYWKTDHILLAGDSAHQSPPFLGQGLCAGIRDVASLAWRLGLVIEGKACERTLDSYANERKSHVRKFIDLAVNCGKTIKSGDPDLIAAFFNQRKIKEKYIFDFPKPQLGMGDWIKGNSPLGQISPQFLDDDGFLSDDNSLYQFILFKKFKMDIEFSETYEKLINYWGVNVIQASSVIEKWLDSLNINAALVRPDRYIYGIAHDVEGVISILKHLHRNMIRK